MDSAHAEAAVLLIEAGADRSRVGDISCLVSSALTSDFLDESGPRNSGRDGRCGRLRAEASTTVYHRTMRKGINV